MHVGSLEIRLFVREARTLKDKRQVVKSIIDRIRNGFNVAVAEVEARDHHQSIVLGIAAVGARSGRRENDLRRDRERAAETSNRGVLQL